MTAQAKPAGVAPPPPAIHWSRARRAIQPMLYMSGSSGGFGGGDDPPKWKPEDKVGSFIHLPRTKLKGGKHLIPANWIDRLLALAVELAGNLGQVTNIMSEIQEVVGDESPLELSFYHFTKSSNGPYLSLTDTSETGFFQVVARFRDELREFEQIIFPNEIDSCGDGKGRKMDIPDEASEELVRRLALGADTIIRFFDRWIGRSTRTVNVPLEGGDQDVTWLDLRWRIMVGLGTLIENKK